MKIKNRLLLSVIVLSLLVTTLVAADLGPDCVIPDPDTDSGCLLYKSDFVASSLTDLGCDDGATTCSVSKNIVLSENTVYSAENFNFDKQITIDGGENGYSVFFNASNSIEISKDAKIRVISKKTGTQCSGCDSVAGSDGNSDGGDGGSGGYGGAIGYLGNSGTSGTEGNCGDASGGSGGSRGSEAGGFIALFTNDLVIDGIINISGNDASSKGSNGGSGWCLSDGYTGGGGGGGAGGSGAGIINIFAGSFSGDGKILANGGSGSKGGSGAYCSHGEDGGGSGSGGSGGSGGFAKVYVTEEITFSDSNIQVSEGEPGAEGRTTKCSGASPSKEGNSGTPGKKIGFGGLHKESYCDGQDCYSNCLDGIDNDYDTYLDFEDSDCYNLNDLEKTELFPSIATAGMRQGDSGTPDWWNPLSHDGLDNICGDDVGFTCLPKYYSCEDVPVSLCYDEIFSGCSLVNDMRGSCSGPTNLCVEGYYLDPGEDSCPPDSNPCFVCEKRVNCADLEGSDCIEAENPDNPGDHCTWTLTDTGCKTVDDSKITCDVFSDMDNKGGACADGAPQGCSTEEYRYPCNCDEWGGGCDTCKDTFCGGEIAVSVSCTDLTPYQCNMAGSDACYLVSDSSCEGDLNNDCDLSADDCRKDKSCEVTYYDTLDAGFVLSPIGQGSYADRFLCLKDEDTGSSDPLTPISYDGSGDWRWWDSYSDTPFRIHRLGGVDYISSGEEWFYCDAHKNNDRFAKRVLPYKSFSIDTYSTDLCAWTPSDFFARKFVDPGSKVEQRLGNYVFRSDCSETTVTSTDIYRGEMDNLIANGYQGKDLSWMQNVLELNSTSEFDYFKGCCYVGDSNEGISTALGWGLFSKEGKDSLGSCMEDNSDYFCYSRDGTKIIPPPDAPPLQPIENEGVDLVDKFGPDSETYVQTIEESACEGRGRDHNVISDVCDLKTTTCVYDSLSDFTEIIPIRSSNPDEDKVCCIGGSCESLIDKTCAELGGFEYYYDPTSGNDMIDGCLGTLYKKSDEGSDDGIFFPQLDYGSNNRCCVGNIDWKQSYFEPVTDVVDAFICYPRSNNLSYFAECCSETTCFNKLLGDYDTAPYKKMFDRGNVFTVGSSLFTILSFDAQRIDDNGNLMDGVIDKIRHYRISNKNELSFDYDGVGNRLVFYAHEGALNWSDFDYLSFDMMWSGKHRPQFLKLYDGSDTLIFSYDLSKYNPHNSMLPMIWVREMLPLDKLGGGIPAYGILSFEIDAPSATLTDVFVDNFALRSAANGDFKNYYCGGELRDWVEGLDTSKIATPSDKVIGAYHLACDAQMSSTWTGSRCCGIATLNSSNVSESEYYNDSLFGCWAGISISEGETVSDAYFNPDFYPDILYFDGSFYSCDNVDSNHLLDMMEQTDVLGNLIIRNSSGCPSGSTCTQITDVGPFGMVGDHYCDAGSDGKDAVPRWRKTTFLPRAKILASKLYSLVGPGDNFTLFCGKPEDGSVNIYTGVVPTSKFSSGSEKVICSMTKKSSSGEVNGFVGVELSDGVDVKDYVDNQLRSFVPLDAAASHPVDCDILYTVSSDGTETLYVDGTITSPEGAFLKCDDSGEDASMVDLNVFYNPNLRLVYFSMEGKGETGFFQRMWEAIVNFFKNLFKSNAGEELAGEYAPLPALPIDLYYNADFEDLYLARQGDLFVKGVMEQTDKNPDAYGLRVDYYNFSSDLSGMEKFLPDGVTSTFTVAALDVAAGDGVKDHYRNTGDCVPVGTVDRCPCDNNSGDLDCSDFFEADVGDSCVDYAMTSPCAGGYGVLFKASDLQSLNVSIPADVKADFDWRYLVSNLRLEKLS